jgi:radical SAM superfamily enzyme YgiQ (UPF0313 family)
VSTWQEHHGTGAVSLITSRGCPYSCTWCSHSVFGKTLRKRSPARVADEVEIIREQYQPGMLWYADDVFNIQQKWLHDYAAELKRRSINIPFECTCRADRMNEGIMETLRDMGCFRIWIGSESGSQRLLDAMKRGVTTEHVQATTRLARQYGIETGLFLMWGFEDENADDILRTIEHVKKANPDIVLTTVSYPIKGTGYFDRMTEQQRVFNNSPWEETNDRHNQIHGRHSSRYYDSVNRWMTGELEVMRSQLNGSWVGRLRGVVKARLGRVGMMLSAHQKGNP